MILKALYDYYDRMSTDGVLAEEGKEYKEIPYEIVIDKDGNFIRLESTVEIVNNKNVGRKYLIKKESGRSGSNSYMTAFCFWDHIGYILKEPKKQDKKKSAEELLDLANKQNESFIALIDRYVNENPQNESFKAVKAFYDNFEDNIELAKRDDLYEEISKKDGTNIIFRLVGESKAVAEHEDIFKVSADPNIATSKKQICIVTGLPQTNMVRISTGIAIAGGKPSTSMVSFQKNSGYDSYYKEQCCNSPISVSADFKYSTALNYLLGKESHNKLFIGGQTILFWSKKASTFEKQFSLFFSDKDDPNAYTQMVKDMYNGIFSGIVNEDAENEFYLIGLSPNAARIFMSLYVEGTISDFAKNIRQHYLDIQLERKEEIPPGLLSLMASITMDGKLSSLPPNLFDQVLASIIQNHRYPTQMVQLCLMRIRADHRLSANRVSILKAYINRNERIKKSNNYITMSLDLENNHPAYLCGRLFAVIEKCQQEAMPGLNATIKDKYYSAASATPSIVFGRLLQMNNVYLSKISDANPGRAVNMNKLIGEITDRLSADGLPKNLNFDNQSRFALGYYHQSNNFFQKSTEK